MKRLLALLLLLTAGLAPAAPLDDAFSGLAIQDRGRKKPFPTFAREMTLLLTGRTAPVVDGKAWDALDLAVALWIDPSGWERKPLILVDYLPLRRELGLPAEEKRFSYAALAANGALRQLEQEAARHRMLDPKSGQSRLEREAGQVSTRLTLFAGLASGRAYAVVPHPSSPTGAWTTLDQVGDAYSGPAAVKPLLAYQALAKAWAAGDAATEARAAASMAQQLRALSPAVYPPAWRLGFESFYLRLHPWRWAWVCYALAALILALTGGWHRALGYRLGWGLALAGFAFQLGGFASRIVLAGRPPVTNMFESIIWVSFGVVLFAMILEAVYRSRHFLIAATPLAVAALMVVDLQPLVFDSSLQPLVPVLRNNFWLSIHVLTIASSYGAFTLAMGLGHLALFKFLFGAREKDLSVLLLYIYRTIQIGVLLLAAGTILGGVWANYSWGRFWDWDPKETWALITLLCYLALLHGRFAGWWGGFGLAIGSLVGFLSVLMAWYGVNFVLGKGLHSYGFGIGGTAYVVTFAVFELALIAVSLAKRLRPSPPLA